MVTRILVAAMILACALDARGATPGEGCGLPMFAGRSGRTIYLSVLDLEGPVVVGFTVDGKTLRRLELPPGRALAAIASTDAPALLLTREGSRSVHVYELDEDGGARFAGNAQSGIDATSFSWATDSEGGRWLFLGGAKDGSHAFEGFRLDHGKWISTGVAEGSLRQARAVPDEPAILIAGWRFSGGPSRRVAGGGDAAELFPLSRGRLARLQDDSMAVALSEDGNRWDSARMVASDVRAGTSPDIVHSVSNAAVVTYQRAGEVVVSRFEDRDWKNIVGIPVDEARGLGGPVVDLGDTIVFTGACLHTRGAAATLDVAVISGTNIRRLTLPLVESAPVR